MTGLQSQQFVDREIDVSMNFLCWLVFLPLTFGAIPYKTTLKLDKEEVTKTDITLCGQVESKRPYGELGSVDRSNCFCCVGVESAFGPISPGCGCEPAKVDDVVVELKGRMRTRGDTAQIQRAEETLQRLDEVDAKLDLILKHLGLDGIPESEKMIDRG